MSEHDITPGAGTAGDTATLTPLTEDAKSERQCSTIAPASEERPSASTAISSEGEGDLSRCRSSSCASPLSPEDDRVVDQIPESPDTHQTPSSSPTSEPTFDIGSFLRLLESSDSAEADDILDGVIEKVIDPDHLVIVAGLYQRRSGRVDAIRRCLQAPSSSAVHDRLHRIAVQHACLDSMLALAEAGHIGSQHALALMYSEQERPADFESWLERAADAGHVLSMMGMVSILAHRHPERSFAYARRAADAGLRIAQYIVGRCLILGQGVDADLQAGLEYVVKAADAGLADAQVLAGGILSQQPQIDAQQPMPSQDAAQRYFEMAADQNHPEALYIVGSMMMSGDPSRGLDLIRRAADLDNPRAQLDLGKMYNAGEHLAEDLDQGFAWCLRAAQHGLAMGAFIVGIMHLEGMGCERNVLTGCHWIERAARAHHAEARKILSTLFSDDKIRDAYHDWQMTQSLLKIMAPSLRLNLVTLT